MARDKSRKLLRLSDVVGRTKARSFVEESRQIARTSAKVRLESRDSEIKVSTLLRG